MMTGQYDAAVAPFEAITPNARGAACYTGVQRTQAAAGHYDQVANGCEPSMLSDTKVPPRRIKA
jgi:hypothetical protein